ncbi:DUF6457 domain-containing protein [Micromonospora sp. CPCC 206060]|uniref:DUF6457 domain-containing protein n=1 Tax=Micromonospora sp. CPCC 206060 TaxID=3122406 RepID=UPI002FF18EF7
MNSVELDHWLATTATALGLEAMSPDQRRTLLDLVRTVAHGVCRPAGPLAAFLIGMAVGRGADPDVACATVGDLVPQEPS